MNLLEWNNFLIKNEGSFLQSWQWGEFQKSLLKKIWRFDYREKGNILTQAQIIKETFPLKNCLYLPFGPCFEKTLSIDKKKIIWESILEKIKKIAKEEDSIFLCVESFSSWEFFKNGRAFKRFQPQKTLIIDLSKNLEEIFRNFHPKTRYNIKLAEKKGVRVKILNFPSKEMEKSQFYFDNFYKLLNETAKRNRFKPYPKEYYQKMFQILEGMLFSAIYEDKIIASNLVIYFGERVVYLHGGSDYQYRALMAPYLLQWTQINEAKKRGFKEYDFWGINEKKWPGITRFKKNFNGKEIKYPLGKDFVFKKNWYKIFKVLKIFI